MKMFGQFHRTFSVFVMYREKDFVCHPDVGKHHLQSLVEAVHESDNQTRHLVSVGHFYLNKVPSHREAQVPVFDGSKC